MDKQAAEHSDHVTTDQFKAGLAGLRTEVAGYRAEVTVQIADVAGQIAEQRADTAEVRTEIANLDTRLSTQIAEVRTEIAGVRTEVANLETRLIRWMVGTLIATATLTVGILRFIGGAACEAPGACGLAQSSILLVNTHSPWIADWMLALEDRRHAKRRQ